MIGSVLKFLKDELNNFLQERFPASGGEKSNEEKVLLAGLGNQKEGDPKIQDRIVVATLVNIEEERILKSKEHLFKDGEGNFNKTNPLQRLNLYVLFSAHFDDYTSALVTLSEVVYFFQIHKFFSETGTANFPSNSYLKRIVIELYSLNFEEQNQLWTSLGAKYTPSLLYKIRTIPVEDITNKSLIKPVKSRVIKYSKGEEMII